MKKQTKDTQAGYWIRIDIVDNGSATYYYENQRMAYEHWLMLRTQGVTFGQIIKNIETNLS
jgi:hypothetical protein